MRRWLRELFGLRPAADDVVPRPPRVELVLVGPVPGSVLRLLAPALVLVCAALAAGGRAGGAPWAVVALSAAALVAWRPDLPTAALFMLLVGVSVYADGDVLLGGTDGTAGSGGLLRVAALVLALHLMLRCSALAAQVSWRGVVERPVLSGVVRSVIGTQVLVQPMVLAVVWLRGSVGASSAGQDLVRVVAVAAVVGVAALVVPRAWVRRRPRPVERE